MSGKNDLGDKLKGVKINLKGVDLEGDQKRILGYLGNNSKEAVGLDDIKNYLKKVGYEKVTVSDVREDLEYLSDVGYVRSKTEGSGRSREEKFYLSKYLGGGTRARRGVQGRGVVNDTSRLLKRLFGSVFLSFGLGFTVYSGLNVTGAVVSNGFVNGPSVFSSFALLVIGIFLIGQSFRN